ncbi:MAG: HEAT repeat domain-containing protein [Elusimicrobia bacterium]|nr:HEAT repeat domain-containing protein [Elusimicrobiota bacterium]
MRRAFALIVLLTSGGFLAREYMEPPQQPPPAPPPAITHVEPGPIFSDMELKRIRASIKDGDPGVRWSAAQLLFSIHDPHLGPILDKMITEDPDPDVRMKVIGLMKGREDLLRLGGLVRALGDTDKGVRLQALKALGDIGDPSVAGWVTALLKDPEPDVRIAALQTLGRFQDKRKQEFRALAEKLKQDYEAALRRKALREGNAAIVDTNDADFNVK